MTGYDFGDRVTGVVADENDWGSSGPRIIPPRREVTGVVVGLYSAAPAVARVQTPDGERLCIRITSARAARRVARRAGTWLERGQPDRPHVPMVSRHRSQSAGHLDRRHPGARLAPDPDFTEPSEA